MKKGTKIFVGLLLLFIVAVSIIALFITLEDDEIVWSIETPKSEEEK